MTGPLGVAMVCDVCDDPLDYETTVEEAATGILIMIGLCEAHLDLLDSGGFLLRDGEEVRFTSESGTEASGSGGGSLTAT